VLATLLLGAGAGSTAAARLGAAAARRVLIALPALVVALAIASPALFTATLGWSLPLRVAVAALLLVPAGFAMGIPFSTGMLRFAGGSRAWFWAVNGAASVVASVFSLAISMTAGFQATMFVGAALYLAASGLVGGDADAAGLRAGAAAPATGAGEANRGAVA
jgi:hypothetical protein